MRKIFLQTTAALLLLATTGLAGCYDDKGNYSYTTLDEVSVDTAGCGIQAAYSIERFDEIEISPNIAVNGVIDNEADLRYLWTLYSPMSGLSASRQIDTLGYERTLHTAITRSGGSYKIQLTVTQPQNGIKSFFKVDCTVEESITAGWMVMYEPTAHPGTSDVGLVVNPLVKKNIIKNREFWDLYSTINGEPIPGRPVNCARTVVNMASAECILGTEETLVGVNNDTFEKVMEPADFFYGEQPQPTAVDYYGYNGSATGELLIMNGKFYNNCMASSRISKFGAPLLGCNGELAPWTGNTMNLVYGVVYSQTEHCFYFVPYNGTSFTHFAAQSATAPFDVNNMTLTDGEGNEMPLRMELADWGRSGWDYMIMSSGEKRWLAVANFGTNFTYEAADNVGQRLCDLSGVEGIKEATTMVSSYSGAHILYGAGDKIYRYYYTKNNPAEVLWSAPSPDETVTCIRLQKWKYSPGSMMPILMPNFNNVLHIATYNESTGEGKLYQYTIKPASSDIVEEGEQHIYTVPGRIKDMTWKWEIVV